MMILHNRSFETNCCDCCKDDPSARIPRPIMDSINNGIMSSKLIQPPTMTSTFIKNQ